MNKDKNQKTKVKKQKLLLAMLLTLNFGLGTFNSSANNLNITNVTASGSDVRFTISWNNSWYANVPPYNWDAVWVFVKYKDCAATDWSHADLSTLAADDSTGAPLEVETVSDGKGVFIKRSAAGGPGNIAATGVRIKLAIPAGTYNFKVFGVEMVYIRPEDFQIGDGTSISTFNSITVDVGDQSSGIVAATLGGGAVDVPSTYPMGVGDFYCMKYEISQEQYVDFLNTLTYDQQAARTDPATPPNSIATSWALFGTNRNGIKIRGSGVNNTLPADYACDLDGNNSYNGALDGQNVACNFLSWADVAAYMDWAALRPMTELEYEKICRGPVASTTKERVWGSASNTSSANCSFCICSNTYTAPEYSTSSCPAPQGETFYRYTAACVYTGYNSAERLATITAATSAALTGGTSGASNETSTASGNGLCAVGGSGAMGPLRVGFSATAATTRITAGATYYGVMDLAGNVWERTVSTDANGVTFTGTLGNGTLDAAGDADAANWPSPATAAGTGRRGAAWNTQWLYSCGAGNDITPTGTWYFYSNYPLARTSNRRYATTVDATRTSSYGGRGVR